MPVKAKSPARSKISKKSASRRSTSRKSASHRSASRSASRSMTRSASKLNHSDIIDLDSLVLNTSSFIPRSRMFPDLTITSSNGKRTKTTSLINPGKGKVVRNHPFAR